MLISTSFYSKEPPKLIWDHFNISYKTKQLCDVIPFVLFDYCITTLSQLDNWPSCEKLIIGSNCLCT